MKITILNPKRVAREKAFKRKQWHKWFAWRPVKVVSEDFKYHTWCWMTIMQRRMVSDLYDFHEEWEYKR